MIKIRQSSRGNKIELSPELTKKAIETGATHYDITLDCFLRASDDAEWVGGLFKDTTALEIDFDPPKSELLAEIARLKAELESNSADAERYRFIRQDQGSKLVQIGVVKTHYGTGATRHLYNSFADDAIDEMIKNTSSVSSSYNRHLPLI